jgi:hypothetical protein
LHSPEKGIKMDCKHHYLLDGSLDKCRLKERDELTKSEINARLFVAGLNSNNTEDCELYVDSSYKKCPFYVPDEG